MRSPFGVNVKAAGKASGDVEIGFALAARALPGAVRKTKAAARAADSDRRFIDSSDYVLAPTAGDASLDPRLHRPAPTRGQAPFASRCPRHGERRAPFPSPSLERAQRVDGRALGRRGSSSRTSSDRTRDTAPRARRA